ncbi:hypothetical protein [Hymenobacter edaphi]|uniref:Uncharacterized protein n=1 Tax=Hymenobacter edaphi TaxID=2211146 RepID=A0A328BF56_9BACT|nr:hypothetical protein [Hymenobacter edaphi]RAK65703.1 hypothetical protein DLM85_13335 [Hymenobacter edaphi]
MTEPYIVLAIAGVLFLALCVGLNWVFAARSFGQGFLRLLLSLIGLGVALFLLLALLMILSLGGPDTPADEERRRGGGGALFGLLFNPDFSAYLCGPFGLTSRVERFHFKVFTRGHTFSNTSL